MAAIDDIEIPSLLLEEQGAAPTTPASGFGRLYIKSDGVYFVDDAGTETGPLGAGGGGSSTPIGGGVSRNANQSIPHNTDTKISWDVEDFDEGGVVDIAGNPTRLTVPAGETGLYVAAASVLIAATADQAIFDLHLLVNGTITHKRRIRASGTGDQGLDISKGLSLTAGDYVEVSVNQRQGGAQNLIGGSIFNFASLTRVS